MTSNVLSPSRRNGYSDALLDREVADLMTPGWVVISEAASVADALSLSGTTRLLVRRRPNHMPEGVLSDFDLAMAAGR